MQTTLARPITGPIVSETEAQRAASIYVATSIDATFAVVDGARYSSKPLQREIWRFLIRCAYGPVGSIRVDLQTGLVIPLTDEEIRSVQEKAAIFIAKQRGVLPVNAQGYVLAEYARRQADSYLGTEASLLYSASDGVFLPLTRPIWQFSIQVRLPGHGVLGMMGTLDVDAQTGKAIPLTNRQLKRIRERADALVEFRTQTAAA